MSKANYSKVGGQAIMEGVMMRSPEKTVMSVRTPDKSITTEEVRFPNVRQKYKFLSVPIIRGMVAFAESLILGFKTISRSASLSGLEEETDGNKTLESMTISEYKGFNELFDTDIYQAIDLITCVNKRTSFGGPSKESVLKQLEIVNDFIKGKVND